MMSIRKRSGALAALLVASLPLLGQAPDPYGAEYAKTKAGGLLLDNMELKQSPAPPRHLQEAVGMNGYVLMFQHDSNLCLAKKDPSGPNGLVHGGWCVNDEIANAYQNIRKVVFIKGVLQAQDGSGKVLWKSRQVADPYARLIISPQGKLMITNAGGVVYWSKGGR